MGEALNPIFLVRKFCFQISGNFHTVNISRTYTGEPRNQVFPRYLLCMLQITISPGNQAWPQIISNFQIKQTDDQENWVGANFHIYNIRHYWHGHSQIHEIKLQQEFLQLLVQFFVKFLFELFLIIASSYLETTKAMNDGHHILNQFLLWR